MVYGADFPYFAALPTLDSSLDLLALHAAWPRYYPVLLQSSAQGTTGRYDILLGHPAYTLSQGKRLKSLENIAVSHDFLAVFQHHWQKQQRAIDRNFPLPFAGGWFVYLGYELAADVEPRLRLPIFSVLPTALAVRVQSALIYDHHTQTLWMVAETAEIAAQLRQDIANCPPLPPKPSAIHYTLDEDPPHAFLEAVKRAKDYLRDGDIFQANLSRAWHGRGISSEQATWLYAALCRANPAPFAGLCRFDDWALLSSSPERLVTTQQTHIQTRPIAGTHPRGTTPQADQKLAQALLAHPKEQAEHIMLIDLLRNDLGKLCQPGTIGVDEMMVVESYPHVHHLVSNVTGTLRGNILPADVLKALFPGGTITGCPKIRCMEIIAELEQTPRGPYTGSMGYVDHRGWMDINILIRSLWLHDNQFTFRAGAGIVHDSDPLRELQETRAKAQGMIRALASL